MLILFCDTFLYIMIHNVGFCIKKERKAPLHACKYFSFECAVDENQYNTISISLMCEKNEHKVFHL